MRTAIILLSTLATLSAFGGTANLVVNGDFEQNGGIGTSQFAGWTVQIQEGGKGSWYVQKGGFPQPANLRCSNESVDEPPSGFAAMSNQDYIGSQVLYQDIAIPQAAKVTLTYDLFIYSHAGFFSQPTLDYNPKPNTQFRADIMDPSAPAMDTGSGVLANIYITKPGDLKYMPYKRQTVDLTQFAGRTIRLRFAEVDNIDCLNAGIDNVSITVDACPVSAPSPFSIATSCSNGCHAGQQVSFFINGYVVQSCDSFTWQFGDGTTGSGAAPSHAYTSPGTYSIDVTITNALGSTSARGEITIQPPPPRRRTVGH